MPVYKTFDISIDQSDWIIHSFGGGRHNLVSRSEGAVLKFTDSESGVSYIKKFKNNSTVTWGRDYVRFSSNDLMNDA